MNLKSSYVIAAALLIAALTGSPIASAHQSPTLAPGLTLEGSFEHIEAVLAFSPGPGDGGQGDGGLVLFGGARIERIAIDARIYAGARQAFFEGGLYALHLEGALGPRMAFRDEVGFGAWSTVRGRGVWTWTHWALHAGLFADVAADFTGDAAYRLRPGGDVGVGRRFESLRVWLNLDGGYSIGGAGAGAMHFGGALGVQW